MTRPAEHPDEMLPAINWGVITTNTIGMVLGAVLTASAGGVIYLVFTLPSQQSTIIKNQAEVSDVLKGLNSELKRLELNDRRQDERLIRIEGRTGIDK